MDQPETVIPCPICGASTEVEYASTGTSIECIGDDGCHALIVMPCFPEEAERCIRARAGRASQDNGGKQLCSSAWLDAGEGLASAIDALTEQIGCGCNEVDTGVCKECRAALNTAKAAADTWRAQVSASNGADERPSPAQRNIIGGK